MIEAVVLLVIGLTVLALIGHGIWVFVAWCFRLLAGGGPQRPASVSACPGCGQGVVAGWEVCAWCGLAQGSPEAEELSDLRAAVQQLRRFRARGVLDAATFDRLETEIEWRRRALLGEPSREAVPTAAEQDVPVLEPADSEPVEALASAAPPVLPFVPKTVEPPAHAPAMPVAPSPPAELPAEEPEPAVATLAAEAPAPPVERPPRRSFAEVLAAFMEQKNILWGELVGGLLIVGCSIALVISLWKTLEENPVYQAAIFVSVTAGLFGAGLYTLSHWKLESTSRGLLVIATLLVPLNILTITTGQAQGGSGWPALAVEAAALLIFGGLLGLAGRVLLPEAGWRFAATVLAVSASQLLIPRLLHAPAVSRGAVAAVGGLPVAGYLLGTAAVLFGAARRGPLSVRRGWGLLSFLGVAVFTLAVALGLLVFRGVDQGASLAEALQVGAPWLAVAGWPVLGGGLLLPRLLGEETPALSGPGETASPSVTGTLRTAGTAVALSGVLLMVAAVVLAWPTPVPVIVACALAFAPLTWIAFRYGLPVAHAAALPCLALGYLAAFHLLTGKLGDGGRLGFTLALSLASGEALAGLVFALALAAEVLFRLGRSAHATYYAAGAGGAALLSLAGVTFALGGPEPVPAMILYAAYGVGSLAANDRWRRPVLSSCGFALLAGATLWALGWQWPGQMPLWGFALAVEALGWGALGAVLGHPLNDGGRKPNSLRAVYAEPLARSAEAVALLALVAALWGGVNTLAWSWANVGTGGCLFALFALLAVLEQRRFLAHLAGYFLLATVAAAVGWAGTREEVAPLAPWFALGMAACSTLMAGVAVESARSLSGSRWSVAVFAHAWLETAAVAGILSLALVGMDLPFGPSPWHTHTGGLLTVTALLLAWGWRSAELTWLGCLLALGGIAHRLHHATGLTISTHLLDFALLIHATLLLLVGLALWRIRAVEGERVERLYATPFRWAGLLSSFAALPFLLLMEPRPALTAALGLFWLAAVWLASAWLRRWPLLFAGSQAVLTLAVGFAGLAWLDRQDWFANSPLGEVERFFDPRSLQCFGLGLGSLSLAWVAARIAGRSHPTARALLEPGWPGVDRLVLIALVIGQLVLVICGLAPALARELDLSRLAEQMSDWDDLTRAQAHGTGAWALLGLLALVLVVALWGTWAPAAVLGLVVLGITVPVLAAAGFEVEKDVGLVLRWGLALAFVIMSAAVWGRVSLGDWAAWCGCRVRATFSLAAACRALLVAGSAAPVVVLALLAAAAHGGEASPLGLTGDWWLGRLPWLWIAVGPLGLVALGLVGHAWRERSPGYAFAAGQVVNLMVAGGYGLEFVHQHLPPAAVPWVVLAVRLFQLGAVTAGAWAVAWAVTQARLGPREPRETALLHVQAGLAGAAVAWLIGWALALLVALHPDTNAWTTEVGSPLGELAWAVSLAAAGCVWPRSRARHVPRAVGLVGFTAVGMLACGVERLWPGRGWGFRALMLGWAAYPLAWVVGAGAWRVARRVVAAPWLEAAVLWAHLAGGLGILLGLQAALGHADRLWAAGAVALVSPSWMVLAVWRRREIEVFLSGLAVNLAASLAVWHFHPAGLEQWRILLLQANTIAASLVALLWLALNRLIYPGQELRLTAAPFLTLQVALGLAGNSVLLAEPVARVVLDPGGAFPAEALQAGRAWGWLGAALALAATAWWVARVAPAHKVSVGGGAALAFGALIACSTGREQGGNWPSFYLLTAAWTLAGSLTLAVGWLAHSWALRDSGRDDAKTATGLAHAWVRILGVLTVLLALRGAAVPDPAGPYWSAGAALAVSLTLGALALASNRPYDVYASGLLINVVAGLLWLSWGPGTLSSFAAAQALGCAVASGAWSVVGLSLRRWGKMSVPTGSWPPYAHAAGTVGLGILGTLTAGAVATSLSAQPPWAATSLAWAALAGIALTFTLLLWDATAIYALAGLYTAVLIGIALGLHGLGLEPRAFGRAVPLALAPLVLLSAGVGTGVARAPRLLGTVGLPERPGGWAQPWFLPAQGAVAATALALGVWVSLDFPHLAERLTGPLGVACLIPAGILMAPGTARRASLVRTVTLVAGAVLAITTGWALLDPSGREPAWLWLHRDVIAMATLAALTVAYGMILPRGVPTFPGWAESGRRLGPILGAVAALLVAVILAQEALLYEGHRAVAALVARMLKLSPPAVPPLGDPMTPAAVAAVAAALLALVVTGVRFAVSPAAAPFGLSERGRTLYVYGAEVLLVLLFVHFRLTVPALFRQGIFLRYWPFVIMAIAFAGVGLSEYLHRRGVRVLAEPLERTGVFLPLLPVLAFWVLPGDSRALLWFTAGLLYAFLFVARRSFLFGLLAALTANAGLWVLLYNHQWFFHEHPQVWLIPLALVGLAAEHLNRDRLSPAQSAGIRYLALIVIYLSSTADMFIAGLGRSVVLPLILAGLSVLGVLAGMLLRVRAFLFLGVTFLVFVLLTVIWHAGVDRRQTWILWSAGIALGVAILTLFGIFEKRRNDVLRLVEELRQWD